MNRLLAASAAVSLTVLAGCTTAPMAPTTSAPAPSTSAPMTPSPSPSMSSAAAMDIVDTAVAAGDFTTLATALTEAGLVETLKGPGPFTVFAPTDDAFAALPEGALEDVLADKELLTSILTYHVVEGEVMAEQVAGMDGEEVTTVQGGTFTVNVGDAGVTLTDAAGNEVTVTTTDIEASNGVIHVIDGVLMPQ